MCGKDFIFVFSNFVFHSNLSFTNVIYYTQKGKITCHREIYQSVFSECAIGNQSLHYISFESYWVWDGKIKKSTFVISSIWQIQVHFGYSLDVRSGRGNVQLVGYSCKLNPLHLHVHSDWIRFSFFFWMMCCVLRVMFRMFVFSCVFMCICVCVSFSWCVCVCVFVDFLCHKTDCIRRHKCFFFVVCAFWMCFPGAEVICVLFGSCTVIKWIFMCFFFWWMSQFNLRIYSSIW